MSKAIDKLFEAIEPYRGLTEGSARHLEILRIYNTHEPLARGYKVQSSDAWCMTFISAMFIRCGMAGALPVTECGCADFISKAKQSDIGYFTTTPIYGDLVFYSWKHDGVANHVGIVRKRDGGMLKVTEGNRNDTVEDRTISIDNPNILCFFRPAYPIYESEKPKTVDNSVYNKDKVSYAASFDTKLAGRYKCTASDFVALRYNPYVADDNMIDEIPRDGKCICYGYHTNGWLLVQYKGYVGFANSLHLERIGKI